MKTSMILASLGLASCAIAVDIYGFSSSGCVGGAYVRCTGIAAGSCCKMVAGTAGATSGQWTGLPGSSHILGWQETRDGVNGTACGSMVVSHAMPTGGSICATAELATVGEYAGLSWQQQEQQQSNGSSVDKRGHDKRESAVAQAACTSSVDADTLVTTNGVAYNLGDMDADNKIRLWKLASAAAPIPADMERFRKSG